MVGVVGIEAVAQTFYPHFQVVQDAVAEAKPDPEPTRIEANPVLKSIGLERLVGAVINQKIECAGACGAGVHHVDRTFDARVVLRIEPEVEDLRVVDLLDGRLGRLLLVSRHGGLSPLRVVDLLDARLGRSCRRRDFLRPGRAARKERQPSRNNTNL